MNELPILSQSCSASEPVAVDATARGKRLPPWLRRQVPAANTDHLTSRILKNLKLETVCDNAKCPNRMECYSQNTATFMILGNVCTRPCGFCSVERGRPEELELDEPDRVAEAAERLGLKHVVITSVTRDDLPDGGADHFYQCVLAVRKRTGATVEVLTPDFVSCKAALERVVEAAPDVFNHNTETVPRLYRRVRGPKSDYRWTLELLQRVKRLNPAIKTKSGLMLGLGETRDELLEVLADLLDLAAISSRWASTCSRPRIDICRLSDTSRQKNSPNWEACQAHGVSPVASGPFVRSSYHAREMAEVQ